MSDANDLLKQEDLDGVTLLRVNAPMLYDDADTEGLFERLRALVDDPARRKFILDLSAVQFFASATLGKLISLTRQAREADSRIVLCNPTPPINRLLQVTRLESVLLAYANEQEAKRSFS